MPAPSRDPLNQEAERKLVEMGIGYPSTNSLPLLMLAAVALELDNPGVDQDEAEELEPSLTHLQMRARQGPAARQSIMRLLFLEDDRSPPPELQLPRFKQLSPEAAARVLLLRVRDQLRQTLPSLSQPRRQPLSPPTL